MKTLYLFVIMGPSQSFLNNCFSCEIRGMCGYRVRVRRFEMTWVGATWAHTHKRHPGPFPLFHCATCHVQHPEHFDCLACSGMPAQVAKWCKTSKFWSHSAQCCKKVQVEGCPLTWNISQLSTVVQTIIAVTNATAISCSHAWQWARLTCGDAGVSSHLSSWQ